jgi:hypothetical protein
VPEGGDAHFDAQVLGDPRLKFRQGQILLFANPGSQAPVVAFQTTAPIAAALFSLDISSYVRLAAS